MGDYAQARYIYSRALKAQREAGMQREQAVTLHNLGRAYETCTSGRRRSSHLQSHWREPAAELPRGEAYALRGSRRSPMAWEIRKGGIGHSGSRGVVAAADARCTLRAQIQLARGVAFHKLDRLPDSITALEDALEVFRQATPWAS